MTKHMRAALMAAYGAGGWVPHTTPASTSRALERRGWVEGRCLTHEGMAEATRLVKDARDAQGYVSVPRWAVVEMLERRVQGAEWGVDAPLNEAERALLEALG